MIDGHRYFESIFTNWDYAPSLSVEENIGIALRFLNLVQTYEEQMEKSEGWEVIFDDTKIIMRKISDEAHLVPTKQKIPEPKSNAKPEIAPIEPKAKLIDDTYFHEEFATSEEVMISL